jgi:hypothetical protein
MIVVFPIDYTHLTNDELIRISHAEPGLTSLERELVKRLESAMRAMEDTSPVGASDFSKQMSLDFS